MEVSVLLSDLKTLTGIEFCIEKENDSQKTQLVSINITKPWQQALLATINGNPYPKSYTLHKLKPDSGFYSVIPMQNVTESMIKAVHKRASDEEKRITKLKNSVELLKKKTGASDIYLHESGKFLCLIYPENTPGIPVKGDPIKAMIYRALHYLNQTESIDCRNICGIDGVAILDLNKGKLCRAPEPVLDNNSPNEVDKVLRSIWVNEVKKRGAQR